MPRKKSPPGHCYNCHVFLDSSNRKVYEWRLKKGLSLEESSSNDCIDCIEKRSNRRGILLKQHYCEYCKNPFKRKYIAISECSIHCRLMNSVTIDKNECWNWKKKGKQFNINNRWIYFQKAMIEHFKQIKTDPHKVIYNKCLNQKCCNIDHIELISKAEDIKRQIETGKRRTKLTIKDIQEIKEKALFGWHKKELAKEYKVCEDSISNVIYGHTFKNIQTPEEKEFIINAQNLKCNNCQVYHNNTESEFCSPQCMQEFLLK